MSAERQAGGGQDLQGERTPIIGAGAGAGQNNGTNTNTPSRDQGSQGTEMSNYDTMSRTTPNLDSVRDPQGGYLGPAAATPPPYQQSNGSNSLPPRYRNNDPERWKDEDSVGLSCVKSWILLGSCCLLGVLTALLGILVFVGALPLSGHLYRPVCTSAECYKTAGRVLQDLGNGSKPCDDFVKFACDGWLEDNPMPESKLRWAVLDALDEKTLQLLKGLLEEDTKADEPRAIKTTRTVYKACVNNTRWDEVGPAPLLSLLDREGGLPMLDPAWNAAEFDVMRTLAKNVRNFSLMYLVSITVSADSKNTSQNALYISQGRLTLPRDFYTPESPLTRYQKNKLVSYVRQTGEVLLAARQQHQETNVTFLNNLYKDAEDLWDFSVKVAEITDQVDLLDHWDLYNSMTVTELQEATDAATTDVTTTVKVDWLRLLNEVFKDTDTVVTKARRVVVDRPKYFLKLVQLLQVTPAKTLANYLLYPLVVGMGTEVTSRIMTPPPLLPKIWSLGRTTTRTWFDCGRKVRMMLPFGVGALYTRHRLTPVTQTLASEIVGDVSAAFRDMLLQASWMDNATLTQALTKLDKMRHLVAYPLSDLLDDLLEELHKGIPDVKIDDHFGNMLALTSWISKEDLLDLDKPVDRTRWPRGSLEMNAFYTPYFNAIIIPLAILQPPLFIPERLTALNYGGVGSIIGHETTHGFDKNGKLRDGDGNLKHWWTKETEERYDNRTQCFVDQYSQYDGSILLPAYQRPTEQMLVSGDRTAGENVADNGGVRAAWWAYKNRVEQDGTSLRLPGLDHYTDDQLFFISFAQTWCTHSTPYGLRFLISADVHTPSYYRIIGVLRNSEEFAEAFQCPAGSPMNPTKKCRLW